MSLVTAVWASGVAIVLFCLSEITVLSPAAAEGGGNVRGASEFVKPI